MIDKNKQNGQFPYLSWHENKPLELYFFIDPLCVDCFSLEPIMKKLQVEYGHYFSLTYVLSGKTNEPIHSKSPFKKYTTLKLMKRIGSKNCFQCGEETHLPQHYLASIAIKAAELQGRKAGVLYLRKLHEFIYLKNENIHELKTLIQCAKEAGLDVEEFSKDIHSSTTSHAFQCDLKITCEMDVNEIPTVVFFNNRVEEEGLKLTGVHPYEVYIEIFKEVLGKKPIRHPLPSLITFMKHYQLVTTREIALLYNWSHLQVEKEMKKLKLQQLVEKYQSSFGTFWRYTGKL
ncbi:ClpXP adapter SpxH family protein [Fervidibacillus halotolerans]|uniref:ClpXP adapter protein SpxH n=1 Tax=Fervidibacillus halotolerans TaxID=2980027 RepID=A0A9E8M172_9BACI|nr:ClpXP adapter SpxH family protein [Fervidibacillus halotolerans]WAA13072.1 DsbA family protein [Fervidibacillus halotolerans]